MTTLKRLNFIFLLTVLLLTSNLFHKKVFATSVVIKSTTYFSDEDPNHFKNSSYFQKVLGDTKKIFSKSSNSPVTFKSYTKVHKVGMPIPFKHRKQRTELHFILKLNIDVIRNKTEENKPIQIPYPENSEKRCNLVANFFNNLNFPKEPKRYETVKSEYYENPAGFYLYEEYKEISLSKIQLYCSDGYLNAVIDADFQYKTKKETKDAPPPRRRNRLYDPRFI